MLTAKWKVEVLITGSQFRAARGLLNMSVVELAEATGLAVNTIRRAEGTNAVASITKTNMKAMVAALEECGIVFLMSGDDVGPGVRLKTSEPSALQRRRRDGPHESRPSEKVSND